MNNPKKIHGHFFFPEIDFRLIWGDLALFFEENGQSVYFQRFFFVPQIDKLSENADLEDI